MKLKAPFPYFGGKARIAPLAWELLGDVPNYVEPFCGSAAMLLARPHPGRIETLNDMDCYVANFWRATAADPEAVATYADGPVNEADLHARHRWLVLSEYADEFRRLMREDPHHYDPKVAGWWVWGSCCWIGSGWCSDAGFARHDGQRPDINRRNGRGIRAERPGPSRQMPAIGGTDNGRMWGNGVHAKGPGPSRQMPQIGTGAHGGSNGKGVLSNPDLGTCADRRAWLVEWFSRLRDRLRTVRVCCGDWLRVCGSDSVTVRLGTTGIFLDPPYGHAAGRTDDLYGVDCLDVAGRVRAYCAERGNDPRYRIILCGYEGEHEALEALGWRVIAWESGGGYGNRSEAGKANARRERLWASPHCARPEKDRMPLFDGLEDDDD